jgi:serine/threonine protein kinase
VRFPKTVEVSDEAKDLIIKLLEKKPSNRLGGGTRDSEEIKEHKWFKGIVWEKVMNKQYSSPLK